MHENIDTLTAMDGILTALYDAIQTSGLWTEALEQLRIVMRSNSVCLRLAKKGDRPREYLFAAGPMVNTDSIHEWERRNMGELGPVPLAPGEHCIVDWSDHRDDPDLAEMLDRYDTRHMLTMCIDKFGDIDCFLNCDRGAAQPDFTATDVSLFRMASGHFSRAMRLRRTLASYHVLNEFKSEALDRLSTAAFILSPIGEVRPLNSSAEMLVEAKTCFVLKGDKLHAVDSRADRKLQAAIAVMISAEAKRPPEILSIAEPDSDRIHNLLIVGAPTTSLLTGGPETCILMFIRKDFVLDDEDSELLQTVFSLTPAETNVAIGLANGKHLDEICVSLGIKKSTVRAHLRSIFLKMGLSRQVDMVHALSNSVIPLGRSTRSFGSREIADILYERSASFHR